MWTPERIAHLTVCVFEKFGSRSIRKLLAAFGTADRALTASAPELIQAGISEDVAHAFITYRQSFDANGFLSKLETLGITALFSFDTDYPTLLRSGCDRPEILYLRGSIPHEPMISVVGSRKMTEYGQHCVDALCQDLVRSSCSIVSGMALGIDGHAHQACLNVRGKTIAVLATGLDNDSLYPRAHVALAHRILAEGGCLLSELPPGSGARKERFPMRNRIIASLGHATVVVEASLKSGSLITAQYALEEGREVLAVPGPIWSEQSQGTNQLIKAGAKPCLAAQDVLDALEIDRPELVTAARSAFPLDPQEREVLEALGSPVTLDVLIERLDLKASRLQSSLSMLELKGFAKQVGGQKWVKTLNQD